MSDSVAPAAHPQLSRSPLLLAGAVLLALIAGFRSLFEHHFALAVALLVCAAVPWAYAARTLSRVPDGAPSRLIIAIVALLARAMLILHPPVGSDDCFRYLWDGRVMRAGVNPYRYAPDDPALAWLRDPAIWPRINHRAVSTVYPPVAELGFRLAPQLATWKGMILLADLTTALLLARWLARRGDDPRRALVWAWCPLVLLELTLDAHVDGLGVPLLVAALTAGPPALAGAALGLAFAVKIIPGALLPLFSARRPRVAIGFAVAAVATAVPFYRAGASLFHGFVVYARTWVANPGAYAWARGAIAIGLAWVRGSGARAASDAGAVADGAARLLMLASFLVIVWRGARRPFTPERGLLAVGALLLLAPAVFPWYVLWVIPLLAASRREPLAALVGVAMAPLLHLGIPWLTSAIHISVWMALLIALARGRAREASVIDSMERARLS
jgi:hypothetical protein